MNQNQFPLLWSLHSREVPEPQQCDYLLSVSLQTSKKHEEKEHGSIAVNDKGLNHGSGNIAEEVVPEPRSERGVKMGGGWC